jgi:hypothetical protein
MTRSYANASMDAPCQEPCADGKQDLEVFSVNEETHIVIGMSQHTSLFIIVSDLNKNMSSIEGGDG